MEPHLTLVILEADEDSFVGHLDSDAFLLTAVFHMLVEDILPGKVAQAPATEVYQLFVTGHLRR